MPDRLGLWLFDQAGLTPHGFCLLWEPGLIWTYAAADLTIGLAYFSISLALGIFARGRQDIVFRSIIWLFAAFILLCGATHLIDVVTLWVPAYGAEALLKAATAAVSIGTAVALWRMLPQALGLPSPAQLREANAALRASEARHRASFEHSPVPMHTLDGEDVITGVSNSWVTLLGFSKNEAIGRPISAFWASGSAADVEVERLGLMAHGELRDRERQFVCRDGRVIEALVSARLEKKGDVTWVVSTIIDVTSRRRAEEALRSSEDRLRQAQKMEAVGQLTGGIAHDFNNMLQSITGSLELTERRISQGRVADAGKFIDTARQSASSAAGLISRMLAFARRQVLQPQAVDPNALLRGMEPLIQSTVGPGVRIALDLEDGGSSALCDENQLESALLNLAINARDAMPDGGLLRLTTKFRRFSPADLHEQDEAEPGAYMEVAVWDTGTGMTDDILIHVFEPFFTTKPIGQGTGLGLSQVYGFIRQSKGFIRLESAPGYGTTVRLFLPIYQPLPQAHDLIIDAPLIAASAGDNAKTSGYTILLVEDEADIRAVIAESLRDRGCRVLEASDGLAALCIIQSSQRLDLLLTDVGLPGLSGRQLADVAKSRRPELAIMLITGQGAG